MTAAPRTTPAPAVLQDGAASVPRRRWQPANLVVGVATLLLIGVFGILAWLTWLSYGSTLAQAEQRALTGAIVVADETGWIITSALLAAQQVAGAVAAEPDGTQAAAVGAAAADLNRRLPGMQLAVYDAAGRAAAAKPGEAAAADISATDYFAALKAGSEWLLAPAPPSNGEPSFIIAQRLTRAAAFAGVVAVTIDPGLLERSWKTLSLGAESTISVVRDDGLVVARRPALSARLDLGTLPVFQTLQSADSGTYQSPSSPADGVARVVAFKHVPGYGAITIASVSQDQVLQSLWTALRTVILLLAPIAVALLLGSLATAALLRRGARTQRHLEAALAHNDVLIREIHHRVKNNLQSVNALLQMQPIPKEVRVDMGQRIAAMSAVHEHIYRSSTFNQVEAKPYIETLLGSVRASYDPEVSLVERLDDVVIDKDVATPLGLILNEVVSNAYKHAFSDGRKGRIVVELTRAGADQARLVVSDNGVGLESGRPPSKGIGRRLIAGLTEQLGGVSKYADDGGTRFELTFPLRNAAGGNGPA